MKFGFWKSACTTLGIAKDCRDVKWNSELSESNVRCTVRVRNRHCINSFEIVNITSKVHVIAAQCMCNSRFLFFMVKAGLVPYVVRSIVKDRTSNLVCDFQTFLALFSPRHRLSDSSDTGSSVRLCFLCDSRRDQSGHGHFDNKIRGTAQAVDLVLEVSTLWPSFRVGYIFEEFFLFTSHAQVQ